MGRTQNDANRIQNIAVSATPPTDNQVLKYDAVSGEYVPESDAGGGDVSSNTATSVDSEIALFSGTGGKTIKRATTTGILKGTSGVIGAAVAGDFPTLNQDTTGSSATLTTPRAIYGNNFDGSAALTGIIASNFGGTGNGFTKFSGAITAEKTYTLPDANATLIYDGGALGTPVSGSAANLTSFPTLNQNTTGNAASLSISGQTGLLTFTGLAAISRIKTIRDAADTILELGGSYTPTGTWTSLTMITPVLGTPTSGTLTNCSGLPVAGGGTGAASFTAYAVLCGGTTSTAALQSIAGVGTSGQVLTSNGAGALPTFQAAAGGLNTNLWKDVSGTFATTSTFTFTGVSGDEKSIERSLFTCLNSGATVRRIGYVKSATFATSTVTVTVITDTDLASGDNTFRIAPHRKVEDYRHLISVPGEVVADASNPQGVWLLNVKLAAYLLPVNSAVRTAAAGAGAACAWNVYKGTTNLFTSAQDMTTNATFDEKRPNTNTISAADNVSLRLTSSAGATNKASDFQAELFIVPQNIFTAL